MSMEDVLIDALSVAVRSTRIELQFSQHEDGGQTYSAFLFRGTDCVALCRAHTLRELIGEIITSTGVMGSKGDAT